MSVIGSSASKAALRRDDDDDRFGEPTHHYISVAAEPDSGAAASASSSTAAPLISSSSSVVVVTAAPTAVAVPRVRRPTAMQVRRTNNRSRGGALALAELAPAAEEGDVQGEYAAGGGYGDDETW